MAATVASSYAPGSGHDRRLRCHCGGGCRFGLSAGCCPRCRTLIRHAAASGAIFAATIGMHPAPAVGRLVSAARVPLAATPYLQSTTRTTIYLATVATPTDKNLSTTPPAKKEPARRARYAAGLAYVVLQ